jgi:hypothetical protein
VPEDVEIETVAHHHRDGRIRQLGGDFPTVPEAKTAALNPANYDWGGIEWETIEDSPGNASAAGFVARQPPFFEHKDSPISFAQPVRGAPRSRRRSDEDDIVAHHLL